MEGLDAIAVMDVEVDVHDPHALAACERDGQRRVVVDAEPGGPGRHRVMQAAARMEGMLDIAAQDRAHRRDRPTRHHRPGLVHATERRHVTVLGDARLGKAERIDPEPLDGVDVAGRMTPAQLVVRGWFGCQSGLGADGLEEIDARPEPPRRQWV